jgi:hypothetical protein
LNRSFSICQASSQDISQGLHELTFIEIFNLDNLNFTFFLGSAIPCSISLHCLFSSTTFIHSFKMAPHVEGTSNAVTVPRSLDALIVGAGFGGLYQLQCLRKLVVDFAGDLGW